MQQGERDFEQISKTIRKEVGRFEASIIIFYNKLSHFTVTFIVKLNLVLY